MTENTMLSDERIHRIVTEHWSGLLGLSTVGDGSDFFADGGTSLLAMRLAGSVTKDLGLRVAVRWIFDHPRFGEFVARVRNEAAAQPAHG